MMPNLRLSALAVVATLTLSAACNRTSEEPTPAKAEPPRETPPAPPAPPPAAEPAAAGDHAAAPAVAAVPGKRHPALLDPSLAKEKAPDVYKAKFTTTKGDFVIEVTRAWAPQGADRFYNLVKTGYFDETRFFRTVDGFMVQFGIHGDPAVNTKWRNARIPDDAVKQSNKKGYVTFATSGPDSRTTQVFINFVDRNTFLDGMGFAPFGKVIQGMEIVDSLYKGYGEGAPQGKGPDQGRIQSEGNAYLVKDFPKLDGVKTATIL